MMLTNGYDPEFHDKVNGYNFLVTLKPDTLTTMPNHTSFKGYGGLVGIYIPKDLIFSGD